MPVLPKRILTFGAGIMTDRMASRLRRPAVPAQNKIYRQLIRQLSATERGKSHGIKSGLDYEHFVQNVPLCRYEDLAPQIERMKNGEADVLWPGQCSLYALSAGTTAKPKFLPVTPALLKHFRSAGLASLLFYASRVGHAGVFYGRHLLLGGSAKLSPISESSTFKSFGGDLSGIIAHEISPAVEKHYYEPGTEIAQMSDSPDKLAAILNRIHYRDITMMMGIPSTLLILAHALREHARTKKILPTNLQAIWPNFECLVHGGAPIGPYVDELKKVCGPEVNLHEIYPASEGFIAAQDDESALGLRLITDAGIFYEFLPLVSYDENRLAHLGAKAIHLADVKVGVDYVLLMTTPAGLCRYVVGDVIRFTSTEPPRLVYVGRTKLRLSAFGEHVAEKELTDSLLKVCRQHDWTITNFHVAPLIANSLTGRSHGWHEWWIELIPGTVITPTGPVLAVELDEALGKRNADYAAKRKAGTLKPPIVRLLMPGTFENWMRSSDHWGGQKILPRCSNDREIADGLARIARFTPD